MRYSLATMAEPFIGQSRMTLIQTAKLNGVNPMAYLADVLERVVSGRTKQNELHTLLPWTWKNNNPVGVNTA